MIFKPLKIGKLEINILTIILFAVGLWFEFFNILAISYTITAIHEFAHILAAKMCGIKIDGVEILPFGITMRMKEGCIRNTGDEIKIALAGPMSNFMIFYLTFGFYYGAFKDYIMTASIVMGLFNLIPVLPLDGGRILRALLVKREGHIRGAAIAMRLTNILAVIIIICGLWVLYITKFNFSFLLIGVFLAANLTEEKRRVEEIVMKDILYSRRKLLNQGSSAGNVIVAMYNEKAKNILKLLSYDRYCVIDITDSNMRILRTVSETELIENMAIYGMNITMKKFVEI